MRGLDQVKLLKKLKLMKKIQFLYIDGENCHFMDNVSFEQVEIPKSIAGENINFLEKT